MLDQMIAPQIREREVSAPAPATRVASSPSQHTADVSQSLLEALVAMAVRSKRRQADLGAALRRAGLAVGRERVLAALRDLEIGGCIEQLVPLSDGGLLLSVTTQGLERLGPGARWDTMAQGGAVGR